MNWQRKSIFLGLVAISGWLIGDALWIHSKALFAQVLISSSWEKTIAKQQPQKPWPWADTWPVARLSVPNKNIELFVLAGAQGNSLAFGPGHLYGTDLPGETQGKQRISIVGGHRDTHFAFLQHMNVGDEIIVQNQQGQEVTYQISNTEINNITQDTLHKKSTDELILVTCYPFNAIRAGGNLRFVVRAIPSPASAATHSTSITETTS